MNIETFLDLKRKYKNSLTKENLFLIIFAFVCTFTTLLLILVLISWCKSIPETSFSQTFIQTFNKLEYLFFYSIAILLFLIFFYIGIRLLKYGCRLWFRDRLWFKKFDMGCKNYPYNNLKKFFDFQGALKNSYKNEEQKCLYLQCSSAGLITKQGFNNFILSFDAKIFYHGFGIILCAKDLENYFMFRVNSVKKDNKDKLFIVPHIRKGGIWEIQDVHDDEEIIEDGKLFNFSITKKNGLIKFIIKDKDDKIVKKFEYWLPNYFPLIQFKKKLSDEESFENNIVPKIEFPKFGKVGFRACGPKEQAIIYNLKIEKFKNKNNI